jgi:hypothetical protein
MNNKLFFLFSVLISLFFKTQAQEFSHEFGKISQAEIDMKEYDKDKSAEAVVIYDIEKSYFDRNADDQFDIMTFRTKRIKILSEAGIKYSQIEIPIYENNNEFLKVIKIKAVTYNYENNNLIQTELKPENIFTEDEGENWKVEKFAMPNVKAGSIIEISYSTVTSEKFSFSWNFQSEIPTVYSEFEIKMIPFYEYAWLLQGADKFSSQATYEEKAMISRYHEITYHDMVNDFVMKDVPAFGDEEYLTTEQDFIMKIFFQLSVIHQYDGFTQKVVTTWPELADGLLDNEYFGKFLNKSKKNAKNAINTDSVKTLPERTRFDYVVNYVKHNFKNNNHIGKYTSQTVPEFIKSKTGNVAEMNLFLTGLLQAVDIDANPVILSTRSHGKVRINYPFEKYFNYVITTAKVDGKYLYADASEINTPTDRIASECINDNALVVKKGKEATWLNLKTSVVSTERVTFKIAFADDHSSFRFDSKNSSTEYVALANRNRFYSDKDKLFDYLTKHYKVDKSTVSITNAENHDLSYIYSYSADEPTEEINDKIYVSPFMREPMTENPLKQATRNYPIDMNYPEGKVYYSEIAIPKGYKIDFVPENYTFKNELFEIQYTVSAADDKVTVSCNYNFTKTIYPASDYAKIKFYLSQIVQKANEKVVFSKI